MIIEFQDSVFPEVDCKQDLCLTYLLDIDSESARELNPYRLTREQIAGLSRSNRKFTGAKRILLPAPEVHPLRVTLDNALSNRHSERTYSTKCMSIGDLSTWLASAVGGKGAADGTMRRGYPSGGALYVIDIYILALRVNGLPRGLYHYDHMMTHLDIVDSDSHIDPADYFHDPAQMENPDSVSTWDSAGGVVILSAYVKNSYIKYHDRSWKLALLEAGHLAQNLALVASAMGGVALCSMGGMWINPLIKYMKLDGHGELPIYPIVFGAS